jgi:hypothetical protein
MLTLLTFNVEYALHCISPCLCMRKILEKYAKVTIARMRCSLEPRANKQKTAGIGGKLEENCSYIFNFIENYSIFHFVLSAIYFRIFSCFLDFLFALPRDARKDLTSLRQGS